MRRDVALHPSAFTYSAGEIRVWKIDVARDLPWVLGAQAYLIYLIGGLLGWWGHLPGL